MNYGVTLIHSLRQMLNAFTPGIGPAFLVVFLTMNAACDSQLSLSPVLNGKMNILGFDQLLVSPGSEVKVTGSNLSEDLDVSIADVALVFEWQSSSEGKILIPETINYGQVDIKFSLNQKLIKELPIVIADSSEELPVIYVSPAHICDDIIYKDQTGSVLRGERACGKAVALCLEDGQTDCKTSDDLPAVLKQGLAEKLAAGYVAGGATGILAARPSDCTRDGDTECIAVEGFPAADVSGFSAEDIRSAMSIAGVVGSFSGVLAACSSDGAVNCLTSNNYPAGLASGASAKIISGQTLAGIAGSGVIRPSDCSADGELGCVAVSSFSAIDKVNSLQSQTSKIRSGLNLANVSGSLNDCSADAAVACVTVSAFPSMQTSGAAAKIASGQSLGGINGAAATRPLDCNAEGATSCVTVNNFPAVDKAALTAHANKIRSSLNLASVTGTLSDCSADGGSGCVVEGPNYAAAITSGAAGKILSGQILAGIAGNVAGRPTDCNADGGTNCTTVTNYPAVQKSNLTSNAALMRSSLSLAGISGTLVDCSADGESSCVTLAAFPAASTAGAAAKILSAQTLAGIAGSAAIRPIDCSADGETSCVATANFPAVDKVNHLIPNASKVRTSLSILGVSGTLAECSSDGEASCVSVASYPAAQASGAAAKILTGQSVAAINGSAAIRPADCSVDGGTGCVAVNNFPAIDKANSLTANASNMRSSLTIAGVSGVLSDCSSDGESSCFAVSNYPAVQKSLVTAGVLKSGTSIVGVTGDYPSVTYPLAGANATADLSNATLNAQLKSSTAFEWFDSAGVRYTGAGDTDITAAQIASTADFFGSSGSLVAAANTCTADGQSACVTTSRYKSMDTDSSVISTWDIRSGKTAGGIAGSIAYYKSMASLSTFNRTAGTAASSSTTSADFYDTVDDRNNGGSMPADAPSGSWPSASASNWERESSSDDGSGGGTAGNGLCDGSETCIFIDKISATYWAKDNGSTYTWENAISYCDGLSYGGYSDWRLPTQKELMNIHINGSLTMAASNKLNLSTTTRYHSATTQSPANTWDWGVALNDGWTVTITKSGSYRVICTRP